MYFGRILVTYSSYPGDLSRAAFKSAIRLAFPATVDPSWGCMYFSSYLAMFILHMLPTCTRQTRLILDPPS